MHLRIVGLVAALMGVLAIVEVRPVPSRARAAAPPSPASLAGPALRVLPIAGLTAKDLHDNFSEHRGIARHEAIDIMEPRGTPVHAVVDGVIAKLFLSRAGGNTIYLFDSGPVYSYYYAHLDHYADGLHEGLRVSAGDVIGYVGSTGNASASAPHLHFTIFELEPEKRWWKGTPVNPYPILLKMVP
ncbi:MAG TPA: M23 family metallopeptidase [Bryobacteraceae bacterium]|nr:M23 family metallopeptidase [Bryobacteraceae bacterium]